MQQDSQLWAMLLWLTGGRMPQFRTEVPGIPLQLRQSNTNKDVTITYKTVYNPHKMLEHYKAPARTSKVQESILLKKAKQYACKVKRPAIRAFTSKCGYNCNMAYAIRDNPSQHGG
eukprot:2335685-Ditylum_brightwellii.AAC.1